MSQVIRIRAAHAISADRFCLALHTEEMGDHFSIILQYDARNLDMPWSRTERNRQISSLTTFKEAGKETGFAALTFQGDVYLIQGLEVTNEKIPGADLCQEIKFIDGTLWVACMQEQVYQRKATNDWGSLPTDTLEAQEGFSKTSFDAIGGTSTTDIYVCGSASGKSVENTPEMKAALKAAKATKDVNEIVRLKGLARKQREAKEKDPEGRILHWDGSKWEDLSWEDCFAAEIYTQSTDKIYIGGTGERFLSGNTEDGFDDWHIDDMGRVHSITKFQDHIICSTSYGLFSYQEGEDDTEGVGQPLIPIVKKKHASLSPLKVQTVDDVMFYFDYNMGVYIWDGEDEWKNIPIPPELLEREFKALK